MDERNAHHMARVTNICRLAYEQSSKAVIAGVEHPQDPLRYLADREDLLLSAVQDAVDCGRLDLALEIVRNLGPLYESMSHLANRNAGWWDDILEMIDGAAHDPEAIARPFVQVLISRRQRVHNEWDKAKSLAEEAVLWCSERSSRSGEVVALECEARESLGEVWRSRGSQRDLAMAIEQFQRALATIVQLCDTNTAHSLATRLRDRLGYAYFLQGNFEDADAELTLADALHRTSSTNRAEHSRTLNNLGKLRAAQRKLDEAREFFTRSLAMKSELEDKRGAAMCHHEIGLLLREDGSLRAAVSKLTESLRLKNEIGDAHGAGLSLMELGLTYEMLSAAEPENASAHERSAIDYLEKAIKRLTSGSPQEAKATRRVGELQAKLDLLS
jgi:tetratricopeptide (TPR) repeat protein